MSTESRTPSIPGGGGSSSVPIADPRPRSVLEIQGLTPADAQRYWDERNFWADVATRAIDALKNITNEGADTWGSSRRTGVMSGLAHDALDDIDRMTRERLA